ncbi:MAG: hypothetical protein Q8M16_13965 [Pirellulaceae bacterium]|nr:hypothetical protein [Pirellulaceae bacterium]
MGLGAMGLGSAGLGVGVAEFEPAAGDEDGSPFTSDHAGKRTISWHLGHLILRPKTSAGTLKDAEQLGHGTLTFDMRRLSWSDTKKGPSEPHSCPLVYLIPSAMTFRHGP